MRRWRPYWKCEGVYFAAEAQPLRRLAALTRCGSTGGQAGLSCCRTGVEGGVLLCCVSEVGDAPLVVVPVFEDGLIGYRQYSVPRDEIGEAPLNDWSEGDESKTRCIVTWQQQDHLCCVCRYADLLTSSAWDNHRGTIFISNDFWNWLKLGKK